MEQQLLQERLVKQQFDLDHDALIENFDGHPERLGEVLPLVDRVVEYLESKRYAVECIYEYLTQVPQSMVVATRHHDPPDDGPEEDVRSDFGDACRRARISGLFV